MPMRSRRRGQARGEADLPAGLVQRLEHRHRMAALAGDTSGLQPRRTRADHHHAPARPRGRCDDVGHLRLAPGGGVVDAERVLTLVDAVEAIGGADARADAVLAARDDLAQDMRVRDVGAGHADHVEAAFGDGVPGGRHIRDAGGVEDGETSSRPGPRPRIPGWARSACP